MSESPATILLIDDHPLLRQGIKQLIDMEEDMVVAGEASNAADGIRLATELEPDLILMDLNMPEMDGIEALRKLREQNIGSRIVMFTVSDQEDDVVSALRAGADGYLLKDMEPEDMITQLHQAAVGKMVISDRLTTLLAQALRSNKPQQTSRPDFDSLTPPGEGHSAPDCRGPVEQDDWPQARYQRRYRQGARETPAEEAEPSVPGGGGRVGRGRRSSQRLSFIKSQKRALLYPVQVFKRTE